MRSCINEREQVMPAFRDDRRGGRWRYRKWIQTPDGRRIRIQGTPPVDTKVAAEKAERDHIDRVIHPERARAMAEVVPQRKEKTIREHAETFLASYKPDSKPSEKRTKRWTLEARLLPYFGDMTISQLDQPTLDGFVAAELKGRSVKTVNNRLAVLSTLIKYVTGDKPRLRFKIAGMTGEMSAVAMEDVEKILAIADPRDRAVVLLAAEAGLRAGEIRGLQWGDVRDGQVTVRRALDNETNEVIAPKHNKGRTVPMSPRIVEALAALPRRGLWVIAAEDGRSLDYDRAGGMLEAITGLYARAGLAKPAMPIHALRHTFGTVMARRVPLGVLQRLMGHSEVTTTMRYVDVSEDDKRDAITAVFGAFGRQVGDKAAGTESTEAFSVEK